MHLVELVFEVVDLGVDRIEQVEVGVCDIVDESLNQDLRPVGRRRLESGRVIRAGPRAGVLRTVTQGGCRDDTDLLVRESRACDGAEALRGKCVRSAPFRR